MAPTRRSLPSLLRWTLPLVMVLACAEHATEARTDASAPSQAANVVQAAAPAAPAAPVEPVAPVAPVEPVAPVAPVAPPPTVEPIAAPPPVEPTAVVEPSPAEPTEPSESAEPSDGSEPSNAARIQAYAADCSHEFTLVSEGYEDDPEFPPVAECDFYEWEQNCSPDPGGCWDDGEACVRACSKPCNTCQKQCVGSCNTCKAACADGSAECIRACAETRATCQITCMEAIEQCQTVDCPKVESDCYAAFNRKRKKRCPQCAEISRCFSEANGPEDSFTVCKREIPKARKECFDWCWDYYEDEDEVE